MMIEVWSKHAGSFRGHGLRRRYFGWALSKIVVGSNKSKMVADQKCIHFLHRLADYTVEIPMAIPLDFRERS